MSTNIPFVSSRFPKESGDFGIRSSDGVVCYFPGVILSRVSPVFRDMFALALQPGQATPVVDITEPVQTLELFLSHLDPNIPSPSIDPGTIGNLLQIAHKYQTSNILQWFEQEVSASREGIGPSPPQRPFYVTHPALTLSLAAQFELTLPGQLALRELSSYSSDLLDRVAPSLSIDLYLEVCRLRDNRFSRYLSFIEKLSADAEFPENICTYCISSRVGWVIIMVRAAQRWPCWSNICDASQSWRMDCEDPWHEECHLFISNHQQREEIIREEAALPRWPIRPIR